MKKSITRCNVDLAADTWLSAFSRSELRKTAKAKGIARGRNAKDTARHIANGWCHDGTLRLFPVTATIEIKGV